MCRVWASDALKASSSSLSPEERIPGSTLWPLIAIMENATDRQGECTFLVCITTLGTAVVLLTVVFTLGYELRGCDNESAMRMSCQVSLLPPRSNKRTNKLTGCAPHNGDATVLLVIEAQLAGRMRFAMTGMSVSTGTCSIRDDASTPPRQSRARAGGDPKGQARVYYRHINSVIYS